MALRKRSEIKKPTASAVERTIPLLSTSGIVRPGVMHCDACGKDSQVKDATRRDDGDLECPSCGMPVSPEHVKGPEEPKKSKLDGPPAKEQPKAYCEECGAEWPRTEASAWKPMPSCGHSSGYVDDPRKATKHAPPAGHPTKAAVERTLPPLVGLPAKDSPARAGDAPAPFHPRLIVEWGKANFSMGDHQHVTIGPFSIGAELSEDGGDSVAAVGRQLVAQLKEVADHAFKEQMEWFGSKFDANRKGGR